MLFSKFIRVFALQLVRECKEVLKGGLLMKQYYQFMLRGVVTDAQGLQTNSNIDEFEEDLHKMLVVRLLMFVPPLLRVTNFKYPGSPRVYNHKRSCGYLTSVPVFAGLL